MCSDILSDIDSDILSGKKIRQGECGFCFGFFPNTSPVLSYALYDCFSLSSFFIAFGDGRSGIAIFSKPSVPGSTVKFHVGLPLLDIVLFVSGVIFLDFLPQPCQEGLSVVGWFALANPKMAGVSTSGVDMLHLFEPLCHLWCCRRVGLLLNHTKQLACTSAPHKVKRLTIEHPLSQWNHWKEGHGRLAVRECPSATPQKGVSANLVYTFPEGW